MTLYQLEVFYAVVETGNFTKAGQLLHASQSGVSHTIADLEKELGVQLFTRTRNGVQLTEAGEKILPNVREIVNQTKQIYQVAAAAKGIQSGTLRIGSFPSVSTNVLPGVLHAFRNRYPNVEPILLEGSYVEIEEWIKAGVVDLGFLTDPCEGSAFVPLFHDPLVAVLPVSHQLGRHDVLSIEQLAHEPFILLKSGCEKTVIGAFQERALNLNTQFEVADNGAVIAMVEAGIGVTIVPSMIVPINSVDVVSKPLNPAINREIGVAALSHQMNSPVVAAFIKEAQNWLAE